MQVVQPACTETDRWSRWCSTACTETICGTALSVQRLICGAALSVQRLICGAALRVQRLICGAALSVQRLICGAALSVQRTLKIIWRYITEGRNGQFAINDDVNQYEMWRPKSTKMWILFTWNRRLYKIYVNISLKKYKVKSLKVLPNITERVTFEDN